MKGKKNKKVKNGSINHPKRPRGGRLRSPGPERAPQEGKSEEGVRENLDPFNIGAQKTFFWEGRKG